MRKRQYIDMRIKRNSLLLTLCVLSGAGAVAVEPQKPDTTDLSPSAIELKEIQVKAAKEKYDGEKVTLYLSQENRGFGTNALDAISSLNRFQTTINAESLTTFDRRKVFILINGVPSQATDLYAYTGDDIQKVEYYSETPGRYLNLTKDPVLNVIIRRRHDVLYNIYANTSNAVTTGFGNNRLNASVTDSLNRVNLQYVGNYRHFNHLRSTDTFDYGNDISTTRTGNDQSRSAVYQAVSATYQRFQGKNLFNTQATYSWSPAHDNRPGSATLTDGPLSATGESGQYLRSRQQRANLSVYFDHSFDNVKDIYFIVNNSIARTSSFNSLWERYPQPYSDMSYSATNCLRNNSYALDIAGAYTTQWLGAHMSVSAQYSYSRLRQRSGSDIYRPETHYAISYITLGWYDWPVMFAPTLGYSCYRESILDKKRFNSSPYVAMRAMWRAKGKLSGFMINAIGRMTILGPTAGELSSSHTDIDRYFLTSGNPMLHSYRYFSWKFNPAYYSPDRRFNIALNYSGSFSHRPYTQVLSMADGYAWLRPERIRNTTTHTLELNVSLNLLPWLEIAPYAEMSNYRYATPSNNVNKTFYRVGGYISAYVGAVVLTGSVNPAVRSVEGDLLTRNSAQYSFEVQWEHRAWSFGARWSYLAQNEFTRGWIPTFNYTTSSTNRDLDTLISITATWRFVKGRARRHAQPNLNFGSSAESGLNRFNTVKQ